MLWVCNVHFQPHIVEGCLMALIMNGEAFTAGTVDDDPFCGFRVPITLDPDHAFPYFETFIS